MNQSCAIDFSTPIRSGAGKGVNEDGTVDACLVQRSYLRAWCAAHPGSPLTEIVGTEIAADAAFIVALVNDYRDGKLAAVEERDRLRAALELFEADYLRIRNTTSGEGQRAELDAWTWGFFQEPSVRAALHRKDGADD